MNLSRPRPPVTVWVLSGVTVAGLVALFLAARSAFGMVASPAQATAAAVLIEAGTIVEALSFARSRNRVALVALGISFVVSATYNVTQAVNAGAGLAWWQVLALGLGPLSALVFISLTLGEELRLYGRRVDEWRDGVEHRRDLALKRSERREWKLQGLQMERFGVRALSAGGDNDRRWSDRAAFMADGDRPSDLTAVELSDLAGISERTARRWLAVVRDKGDDDGLGMES